MKKSTKIPGPTPSRKADAVSASKDSGRGKFSVSPSPGGKVEKKGSVKQTPTGVEPTVTKVGSDKAFGTPMKPVSFKK